MIHADAEQIKQVFFNVIGNALDAVGEIQPSELSRVDDHYVFAKLWIKEQV